MNYAALTGSTDGRPHLDQMDIFDGLGSAGDDERDDERAAQR